MFTEQIIIVLLPARVSGVTGALLPAG